MSTTLKQFFVCDYCHAEEPVALMHIDPFPPLPDGWMQYKPVVCDKCGHALGSPNVYDISNHWIGGTPKHFCSQECYDKWTERLEANGFRRM